jgi:hypothetical protein
VRPKRWASWFQAATHLSSIMMCSSTPGCNQNCCSFVGATTPSGPGLLLFRGILITLRHIRLGRTPVDEWSNRRKYLYLTAHDTHIRHTSMHTAGFEHAVPSSNRHQTHVLGHATTGIGAKELHWQNSLWSFNFPASKWSKSIWNIERRQSLPLLVQFMIQYVIIFDAIICNEK